MQEGLRYTYYYKSNCPVCVDVELILDDKIYGKYNRFRLSASENPSFIYIWKDDDPIEVPETMVPGVPALWDRKLDILMVGDVMIEKGLDGTIYFS